MNGRATKLLRKLARSQGVGTGKRVPTRRVAWRASYYGPGPLREWRRLKRAYTRGTAEEKASALAAARQAGAAPACYIEELA